MLENIFKNIPPVVKNLLIINLLFFFATWVFEKQGIHLSDYLGLHYVGSLDFQPYQLVTHFFMHGGLGHIFFNMFALVVFGSNLERIWGAKRFLMFYFVTALGAAFLHQLVQAIELYNDLGILFPTDSYLESLNGQFRWKGSGLFGPRELHTQYSLFNTPTVGASGAIYGLIMATAMLFPNTVVHLYFAIPVKMKWLALGLGVYAVIRAMQDSQGDSVAHFAHLGGMLFGFILLKIWQKDKSQFY